MFPLETYGAHQVNGIRLIIAMVCLIIFYFLTDKCLKGWHRRGDFCYLAVCQKATYDQAYAYCRDIAEDSFLASIHSIEEDLFVSWLAKSEPVNAGTDCVQRATWIGLEATKGIYVKYFV